MRASRVVRLLQGQYFVYCTQAWQRAAALATLRIPISSPPITASTFQPSWMEGKHLLIFKLHGYADNPFWFGLSRDGLKPIALTPDLVRQANLTGSIVIAIVCHGAGGKMAEAFFEAGALAFFGSSTEVRARETEPGEADNLTRYLLRTLVQSWQDLPGALARAKELYRQKRTLTEHDQFTLDTFMLTMKEGGVYG